jgi:hypothetical protein
VASEDGVRREGGFFVKRPPRFYLTQFGAVWVASLGALERLLEGASKTGCYDLEAPGITRLRSRFSEASYNRREGFLPRFWRSRRRVLLFPLDQPQEWFGDMLAALRRGDYDEMRGFTSVED